MVLERTVGLPTSMPYSVECPSVSLISNFSNGSKVTLTPFPIVERSTPMLEAEAEANDILPCH